MASLNYVRQNLQNRSFKGQDLSGADFSDADLRGCNFTGANLTGAKLQRITTGQSSRQSQFLMATAIVGPIVLFGCSAIIALMLDRFGSDRSNLAIDWGLKILSVIVGWLAVFWRNRIMLRFPYTTDILGTAAISMLLMVMGTFTGCLALLSLLNFGNAGVLQGLFLLILMGIGAIVTFRILQWLIQSIQSSLGTSFRKANLTDADLEAARIQNTDFSLAMMTGVCISNWVLQSHTQFSGVDCEYIYLEPMQQNRQPPQERFQPGELERVLTRKGKLKSNR